MSKIQDNFIDFFSKTEKATNIHPVHYVNTGSNVYGLSNKIHKEHAGIHLLDTKEYLKHPMHRKHEDVLRFSYNKNGKLVAENSQNRFCSITSFEMWKFIDLYNKGSIVTYDMLYLSPTYNNKETLEIINLLKEGISSKIGREAKTYAMNNWQKDRTDTRKIVMSFYRLLQAIIFLREEEYISDAKMLWEYDLFKNFVHGKKVFNQFVQGNFQKEILPEKQITGSAKELEILIDEINKALIFTKLPENTSEEILLTLLNDIVKKRIQLI